MSDQVDMPNVFDYIASAGYMKRGLMAAVSFSQQRTLGGGDIRRQDMPFVSNRMNFSRVGAMVMYPIPKLERLAVAVRAGPHVRRPERGRSHHVHDRPSVHVQREARLDESCRVRLSCWLVVAASMALRARERPA